MKKKVARFLELGESEVKKQGSSEQDKSENLKKAQEFDRLMHLVKEKLPEVSRREKVQLLTLVPISWSRCK